MRQLGVSVGHMGRLVSYGNEHVRQRAEGLIDGGGFLQSVSGGH